MAKIQRNFRLEPDVDTALNAAINEETTKVSIVDHALRVELGMIEPPILASAIPAVIAELERIRETTEDPGDGLPREVFDDELLDRINELRAMDVYDGGTPDVEPSAPESPDPLPPAEPSFESILAQVEAVPEDTRRAVLERLLGQQLQVGEIPKPYTPVSPAHPSWAEPPIPVPPAPGSAADGVSPGTAAEPAVEPAPEMTDAEIALAEQISGEDGVDMPTAKRMARKIVQKRAEAA